MLSDYSEAFAAVFAFVLVYFEGGCVYGAWWFG